MTLSWLPELWLEWFHVCWVLGWTKLVNFLPCWVRTKIFLKRSKPPKLPSNFSSSRRKRCVWVWPLLTWAWNKKKLWLPSLSPSTFWSRCSAKIGSKSNDYTSNPRWDHHTESLVSKQHCNFCSFEMGFSSSLVCRDEVAKTSFRDVDKIALFNWLQSFTVTPISTQFHFYLFGRLLLVR